MSRGRILVVEDNELNRQLLRDVDCIRIEARSAETGWFELRVSDKGPGIPDGERENVFEKYYRLGHDEQRSSPARSSRGMGLAYCRLAAEAMGGRIWVEENVPYGCVFCVRLPERGAGRESH